MRDAGPRRDDPLAAQPHASIDLVLFLGRGRRPILGTRWVDEHLARLELRERFAFVVTVPADEVNEKLDAVLKLDPVGA